MPSIEVNVSGKSTPAPRSFPCPLCGEMLPAGATECSQCDWVKGYRHREPVTEGTPRDVMAVVLSVVPGLGHIFKGHTRTGIIYMIMTGLVLFFIGLVGMVGMGFQLLLLPFYWVWTMLHAYLTPDLKPVERHIPIRMG